MCTEFNIFFLNIKLLHAYNSDLQQVKIKTNRREGQRGLLFRFRRLSVSDIDDGVLGLPVLLARLGVEAPEAARGVALCVAGFGV